MKGSARTDGDPVPGRPSSGLPSPSSLPGLLLSNIRDVIHLLDDEGVIRYITPSVEGLLGYTPDELVGRPGAEFVHPEDAESVGQSFAEALGTPGWAGTAEMRLLRRDGSIRWVSASARRIEVEGSTLVLVTSHDITERRQAEEALRRSEERLRLVVLATHDAVWDLDVASGRITWNDAAARVFRCHPEEIGSDLKWWYDHLHPDDRERVVSGFHAAVEGAESSWSAEYRFRRGDGSYATMLDRGHLVRTDTGEAVRMVGSMLDISDRKRAEEEQRFLAEVSVVLDSSLDYRATLASVARLAVPMLGDYCLIDVLDERSKEIRRMALVHADPARQSLLREEERLGLHEDESNHPVLRVMRTGTPVLVPSVTEERLDALAYDDDHRAALEEVGIRSYIIAPMSARGRILGTITLAAAESGRRFTPVDMMLAENLARRAGLAVDNARLYEEAQRALKARETILAAVSHDLRNPLGSITLLTSTELARDDLEVRLRETLEIIEESAGLMDVLIQDLLDISRLDAGQLRLDLAVLRPDRILADVDKEHEEAARRRSIRLVVEPNGELPPVRADPARLRQVFSNLVGNALKFTPEGGEITVRAEPRSGAVCFAVSDTGPGVPPEDIPHLFDPFWQGRHSRRDGVGLGLAIVRGIVEAQGGEVWAESAPGKGTTVHFTVPAAGQEPVRVMV